MHPIEITPRSRRSLSLLLLSTVLLGGAVFVPLASVAGTGGVPGGCAFTKTVSGKTEYEACTGANVPMWYSAQSPTYSQGDYPCGQYGNQNCGMALGAALNE